jgi:hypothetical protein
MDSNRGPGAGIGLGSAADTGAAESAWIRVVRGGTQAKAASIRSQK